jgi:hypothetical protein
MLTNVCLYNTGASVHDSGVPVMITEVTDAGDDSVGVGPAMFEMADVEIVTPYPSVLSSSPDVASKNQSGKDGEGDIQLQHIAVVRTIVRSLLPQEHILPNISVYQYTAPSQGYT